MIFEKRVSLRPYEYPHLLEYVDAMRHSYWIHTEYNYSWDIQDFSIMSDNEKQVFMRTMLAIAQIEVAVKSFWSDIHKTLPKPEIASVGITFWESEVRHENLYSHILDILWLQSEFEHVQEIDAIRDRIHVLDIAMKRKSESRKEFIKALIFFSLFVENVSLFSQFYIAMSYNKFKNMMRWMSNWIEASTKEENLHASFGIEIINIIKDEYPSLLTEDDLYEIKDLCNYAIYWEHQIIDWIFEGGELDFVNKHTVKNYITSRMAKSLEAIWIKTEFEIDKDDLQKTKWFEDEVLVTKHTDFFNKRSINYTKKDKSFSSEDLF